ncbi:MAG: hypothetical protein K2X45_19580 [Phreatobacter sp.]|nr:hypothetical protein [Phreatobacter sp.]
MSRSLAEPRAAALGPGGIGALTSTAPAGYAGSASCAGCHESQTRAWLASQHASAMSRAEDQTVLGDFSDVRVEHRGSRARFFRDGTRFMVETEGGDGRTAAFEITDTFGISPLQQYLVTFPDGRRQALPFAYDTRPAADGGQRWFHLYPDQAITPSDPLHWTGDLQNWNFMCAECHSTALTKTYDRAQDRFDTRFSETSVGCEACHGAGRPHVQWAMGSRDPAVPHKGFETVAAPRPPITWTVDPASGSPTQIASRAPGDEVDTCARCHARRATQSEHWRPGQPVLETHRPSLLSEGLFDADGQMRDEVFNDQTFRQSLMYARGVVCSDCHDPHSAKLRAPGSAVCGQCHLPDRFGTTAHSGHASGPGAPDCVSCHMPRRTYMVIDERHDHSFRIPRPDQSVALGTSNTCNDCHRDKSPAWAAAAVERWHGPVRKGFQTWAGAFHAARAGAAEARNALIALAAAPSVPAIARATAVAELRAFPARITAEALRQALSDPDPLVRASAASAHAGLPLEQRWALVSPLLSDPVAGVRLAAAETLADQPPGALPEAERTRLRAAFAEYEAALRLNSDQPEGRASLASFRLRQQDVAGGEAELVAGLRFNPRATVLSINLADLYRLTGREAQAEATLRSATAAQPEAAAAHHALGLSLIRQRKHPEALAAIALASQFAPENPRYAYVHAVALRSLGEPADSARIAAEALARHPNNVDLLTLALDNALRANNLTEARRHIGRLVPLRPDNPEFERLSRRLQ